MISAPVGGLCVLLPEVHSWAVSPALFAEIPWPRDGPATLSCNCSRYSEFKFDRRASSDNVLLIRDCLPHGYDAFSGLKAFYVRRKGWVQKEFRIPRSSPGRGNYRTSDTIDPGALGGLIRTRTRTIAKRATQNQRLF